EQAGMKHNLSAAPLQDRTTQIVFDQDARRAFPVFESVDQTAKKIFQNLLEEEFQIHIPGIGQKGDESGESATGLAYGNFSEVCPVDLALLCGEGLQAEKR